MQAKTMVELRQKIRRAMGWPDCRSWTAAERAEVLARFSLDADHERGVFVAVDKQRPPVKEQSNE